MGRINLIRLTIAVIACATPISHLSAGEAENIGLTLQKEETKPPSKFFDPDDGCFDLSQIIEHPLGFIPMVIPITEPAIGYGGVGSLIFISENENSPDGKKIKPNIAALGVMGTQNGTEGYFAMHSGNWLDGKLQTFALVADMSVNLDFHGASSRALQYNIDGRLIKLEGKYRLGTSRSMLGLAYTYGDITTQFKTQNLPQDITFGNRQSNIGSIGVIYNYDTRDNIFTPNKGFMGDITATFDDPAFGSSATYQKLNLSGFYYRTIYENLVFGLRGTAEMSFGDTPFYQLPFIQLRGIPAMRYQGESIAFTEAELRWKIRNRTSLIGFAGAGATSSKWNDLTWNDQVASGGVGIRYELARKQGLHMGLDLGFSKDTTAIYVVFGSAWMRP
jgi:hypothetical protein